MAVICLKDGRWVTYYRARDQDGVIRIKREYFGRGPLAEAKAHKRDGELAHLVRRPRKRTIELSFLELSKEYRDKRGLNANSRNQLGIRLAAHLLPEFGAMAAARIKSSDLETYVKRRRADGVADATICREITDLKAILNWAVNRDPPLIPYNPVANFRKPRSTTTIARPPSEAEAGRILKHALPHVRRAILLGWHLGLRPQGELLSLQWSDVNWETGRILVMSAHKGGPAAREVPIHPNLMPHLVSWYTEDRRRRRKHIVHYHGRHVKSIGRAWRSAVAKAKIGRKVRPYDLRHYFVSRAMEEGADLKALSEIVGSSPQTLLKFYQHVTGKQHEKTVAMIKPLSDATIKKKRPKKDA